MKYSELQELLWDWHQHKTDPFGVPDTIIMNNVDLCELIDDCGNKYMVGGIISVNKVQDLDIAIWEDPTKEPLIL